MSKFAWLCAVLFLSPLPGQAPAEAVEEFKQSESLLSAGQIATFGDRLLAAGDASDVAHLVQVGNMLYRFDPPRALRLHEQALKLSPDHTDLRLELGYDYTAAERCPDAIRQWDALHAAKPLIGESAAIAAYCHLAVGRFDDAVALWQRSDYSSRHTAIEKAIHNVFGRPDPVLTHAEGFRAYAANGWGGAGRWVRNALVWEHDWWNQSLHKVALEGMRAALRAKSDDAALRELDCTVAMQESSAADPLASAKACGLLHAEKGLIPHNSGIAYMVAVRLGSEQYALLNARWGGELLRRAGAGDLEALQLLAALRANAGDGAKLAEVDELGWSKFKLAEFALSRLYGLAKNAQKDAPADLDRRLAAAARQFPHDARIQLLDLQRLHTSGTGYRDAIARVIVAEYHGLPHSSALGAQPNARGLAGFFVRLAQAQQALAEDKLPSVKAPKGE